MISYKTLEDTPIENIHETFIDAFSDYQVKIDLPLWKLENMLNRRGYNAKVSMGAFDKEKLVGFILNGLRIWNNKRTVYDTGTGVVQEYRKQGITTTMFEDAKEILINNGVECYLLEVIKTNTAALELYKKQGFEIVREFECLQLNKSNYKGTSTYEVEHVASFSEEMWNELMSLWDVLPSWQNSINSIKNVKEGFIYSVVRNKDSIIGYGIIDKNTGDIPQIAVHKDYRGKGIGMSIISDLLKNTEAERVAIINVDENCKSTIEALQHLGFESFIGQYEMILNLVPAS